jgi:hypothetical protein
MAEVIEERRETLPVAPAEVVPTDVVPPQPRARMSWGAIFGGAFTTLGLWLLLYTFGLAVGLSSIDTSGAGSMRPSGVFAGVWAIITPLISLFIGGWVAGRGIGVFNRSSGAIHGLVMWGLTTLAGAAALVMLLSAVVSGVFNVGRVMAAAGGGLGGPGGGVMVGEPAGGGGPPTAQALGIDTSQALPLVNDQLRAEGKPPITAAQLDMATRDAVRASIAHGSIDRETLAQSIAAGTGLSPAGADQFAGQLQVQLEQKKAELQQNVKGGAAKAVETSGKAFWGAFAALLLGLIAAVAGGALGGGLRGPQPPRRERVVAERRPLAPPREVYP